jgi:cyclopropane fatty-acyl-phospholipid synthase-like methyltransferase
VQRTRCGGDTTSSSSSATAAPADTRTPSCTTVSPSAAGGRAVVQTILIPSLAALGPALATTRLGIYGVDEIGPDYAETLRRWRQRFHASLPQVYRLGYDRRFERTWDFSLACCEAGFRTRWLRDAQLVLERQ